MRGSCLTYTVASTGFKNTPCSFFGIFWKLVVFQEFRVRTQSQDLGEEDKINRTISDINRLPDSFSMYECSRSSLTLLINPKQKKWSYLSEKCDWFLTHGVSVAYVSLDDFCEWFLDSLETQHQNG